DTPGAKAVLAGEDVDTQTSGLPELDPPVASSLYGRPIVEISVVSLGGRWASDVPITSVHLGDPLAPEHARLALREAVASGRVARAAVEILPDAAGVRLVVDVLPRRIVAAVRIEGGVLESGETLDAAQLAENTEVTATLLPKIGERIRRFYAQRGFPDARVVVDTSDTDDPEKVVVAVAIESGEPRRIAQRVFVVDPKQDREIGDLKSQYKLGRGARVDEVALADADRDMTELLKQNGFFRADVRHAQRSIGTYGYVYVYLNPGPRFVPVFDGQRAFDKDQLAQALDLQKQPEWKTAELVDRLKAFYVARGFYDVEISAVERGRPADPLHYLAFSIHEHPQVKVKRRVFPCLAGKAFSADDLGREIDSFLEDELPGGEVFTMGDPNAIDATLGPKEGASRRAETVDLNPHTTYAPDTYERALKHLRDLVHSKGYLNAVVGPASLVRARCSRRSPPGVCVPEAIPEPVHARCLVDATGLPLPEPDVPDADTCRPDPAKDVDCSPDVVLRIPVHLGPATTLYDLAFDGNAVYDEKTLANITELSLGAPVSNVELEAARLKLLDHYKNAGFAYAEVRWNIEPSPDRTRARVRFYVTERDRVIVSGFVVKGNTRTSERLILGRLELRKGQPYRQNWVRESEQQVATLGTFSSVSISLEDPDVPQRQKRVIVTVAETLPQYLEPLIGFSTGDGIRFGLEYGHHNVGGLAISIILRLQLSYIFDFMILDPHVLANYDTLSVSERLERRDTVSLVLPEVGLGPRVSAGVDFIDVRDNQYDFGITKEAAVPSLTYRPFATVTTQLSGSVELNDVAIFDETPLESQLTPGCQSQKYAVECLLRAPEGRTIALAQRLGATWDRRDNPFAATRGTLLAASVEHVNAFPSAAADNKATIQSHFLKLSGKASGYVRLTDKGMAIAVSLAAGYNVQLDSKSKTYPDRLFFLGGVDSMRDFLADSLIPEDIAQQILHGRITVDEVPLRGGDFFINPRLELRIPVRDAVALGLFVDAGNLWVDPAVINVSRLRYAAGAGLRIATPIGPIALDYGINLDRRPWEDFGAFSFSIGLF
ncbi:MAG TPA: POTRA domain-containing protein, partial [Minicystis sp.]|nr:POTRA domain-containing protein [Minicystis sp.]